MQSTNIPSLSISYVLVRHPPRRKSLNLVDTATFITSTKVELEPYPM